MLRRLSGRTHEVLTGVSLGRWTEERGVGKTRVWFGPLDAERSYWYVQRGGPGQGRRLCHQGLASRFIPRIDGSYTNVVGLPVRGRGKPARGHNGTYPGPLPLLHPG